MGQIINNSDSGLIARTKINQQLTRYFNVETYGALHDYQTVSNASISSGTNTVTLGSAAFASTDVGKTIRLSGAGAAGIDLITTISGYTSATQVTITNNASTTISAKKIEWATNDTPFIQAAIQAAFDAGGGTVYFPNGIYYIAGSLITSLNGQNPNCQLYIPLSAITDVQKSIKLLGESAPHILLQSFAATDMTLPVKGVILFSPIVGSGTDPAVLGTSFVPAAGAVPDVNYTQLHIENIAIKVKSRTGTTDVANIMSAFYLRRFTAVNTSHNVAFAESDPFASAAPTAGYGFYFPERNQAEGLGGKQEMNVVYSFFTGFRIYEHENLQKQASIACLNGFQFGCLVSYTGHMNVGQIATHYCKNNILFSSGTAIDLAMYTENYVTADKWFLISADFLFTGTPLVNGTITMNVINAPGGSTSAASKSGAFTGNLTIRDNNAAIHTTFGNSVTAHSGVQVQNLSTAATSYAAYLLKNAVQTAYIGLLGSAYTTSGNYIAGTLFLQSHIDKHIFLDALGSAGLIKLQANSVEGLRLSGSGLDIANFNKTITSAGTTGAQTINKLAGTVNFAAAASSLVVTNSLVTANSIVLCTIRTNDGTALIKNVVPTAGSFTITLNAAATAETSVGFLVIN